MSSTDVDALLMHGRREVVLLVRVGGEGVTGELLLRVREGAALWGLSYAEWRAMEAGALTLRFPGGNGGLGSDLRADRLAASVPVGGRP